MMVSLLMFYQASNLLLDISVIDMHHFTESNFQENHMQAVKA